MYVGMVTWRRRGGEGEEDGGEPGAKILRWEGARGRRGMHM